MASPEDNTLRIVLVGKTRSGKSATANTILGRRDFDSRLDLLPVTKSCQRAMRHWKGRNLLVVDTPGIFPNKETWQTTCKEISQCVLFSYPGPHAIILVIQLGVYTMLEQETFALIKALFGEQAMNHMIILFTYKDDLENMTLHEFIANAHISLQSIIKECENRCCAFNNSQSAGEAEKEAQVQELVEMIEEMVQKNEGAYFSDAIHKDIDKKLKHLTEDLKIIYAKQLENEIKLVEKQCAQGKISQQEKEKEIKYLNSQYDELVKCEKETAESNIFLDVINGIWKMFSNK